MNSLNFYLATSSISVRTSHTNKKPQTRIHAVLEEVTRGTCDVATNIEVRERETERNKKLGENYKTFN